MTELNKSVLDNATTIFDQEYFSGSSVSVYIGDVWVDEIVNLSVQVTQVKTPIYGYASQLYDGISRGPVLVRGSFSINFKESGYLFVILDRFQTNMKSGKYISPIIKNSKKENHPNVLRSNIERMEHFDKFPNDDTVANKYQAFQDLAGFAHEQYKGRPPGQGEAEDIFENYEDAVWGKLNETQASLDSSARRADDHRINDFDIYIMFGDWTNELANHTVKKISQVHILGSSIVIDANGQPLAEDYSFIARNFV